MILIKKWENKYVYKSGKGSILVSRDRDFAIFETEDIGLIRALKIVHGFKESKEPIFAKKEAPVKMTKKSPSTEKQVKKIRKSRAKKSDNK